ncbi:hypothetical protein IAQ61_001066 [Plenodomus lingam]|uniref:uncharacterized protein n=1 Tax=Leptosphaeria maculans TaxID=5022 RepID=UPI00331B7985|nr:hypothetical protein IAQ61_001066 [Plenodomus lingam]
MTKSKVEVVREASRGGAVDGMSNSGAATGRGFAHIYQPVYLQVSLRDLSSVVPKWTFPAAGKYNTIPGSRKRFHEEQLLHDTFPDVEGAKAPLCSSRLSRRSGDNQTPGA